ncbi:carbohydrate ABC transporter permease [Anaeromicropila herbilytica]|uniref:Lactose ABC transporter permease n=1 Tax=Anaeromicropila herbilytica TaxID=2785025 RepID=A0A7R7EJ06_9FIRM|nr:sugar ABC transporter permease [Anaeromicropila herbilytica]BCN29634.1 lactose ABC transporter permease [Anaeromicropila herbilytica]
MKSKKLTLMQKRALTGLIFISPWLVGFIVFYLVSLIKTIQFSLCKVSVADTGGYALAFKGLSNFKYALFQDADFNQILVNSVIGMLVDMPLIIFFSLFMAILLNQKFKGRTIVRAIFFIPVIMNAGAINDALELARQLIAGGLSAVASDAGTSSSGVNVYFLFDTFSELGIPRGLIDYIIGAVSRSYDIVRASGVQIIIFLAALQSVPGSLYEVSKIEGATAYETFWKVTFPMVTPLILTNVVYTIVDSFVTSDVVDMAYKVAITDHKYGISSAMSLLSTGVVSIVLIIVGILVSRKTFYYN